jgi:hypothetical protein
MLGGSAARAPSRGRQLRARCRRRDCGRPARRMGVGCRLSAREGCRLAARVRGRLSGRVGRRRGVRRGAARVLHTCAEGSDVAGAACGLHEVAESHRLLRRAAVLAGVLPGGAQPEGGVSGGIRAGRRAGGLVRRGRVDRLVGDVLEGTGQIARVSGTGRASQGYSGYRRSGSFGAEKGREQGRASKSRVGVSWSDPPVAYPNRPRASPAEDRHVTVRSVASRLGVTARPPRAVYSAKSRQRRPVGRGGQASSSSPAAQARNTRSVRVRAPTRARIACI